LLPRHAYIAEEVAERAASIRGIRNSQTNVTSPDAPCHEAAMDDHVDLRAT